MLTLPSPQVWNWKPNATVPLSSALPQVAEGKFWAVFHDMHVCGHRLDVAGPLLDS